jgi:hypothetical protein
MTTRCRPGDLAIVLRGLFTGSAVTVIELAEEELLQYLGVVDRPCWVVDRALDWGEHDELRWPLAPDRALLPIRPEPDARDLASGRFAGAAERMAGRQSKGPDAGGPSEASASAPKTL